MSPGFVTELRARVVWAPPNTDNLVAISTEAASRRESRSANIYRCARILTQERERCVSDAHSSDGPRRTHLLSDISHIGENSSERVS